MDEKILLEKIQSEYGLFYDLIKGLVMPIIKDSELRFKGYRDGLYDWESSDSVADAELKTDNLLHLANDFLYDAERLVSKE
jgi:hypothetical protein